NLPPQGDASPTDKMAIQSSPETVARRDPPLFALFPQHFDSPVWNHSPTPPLQPPGGVASFYLLHGKWRNGLLLRSKDDAEFEPLIEPCGFKKARSSRGSR